MKNLGEIIYGGEKVPWEKGVVANNIVFLSGIEGIDPSSGAISPEINVQTRLALDKMKTRLGEAGTDVSHVVKYVAYVVGRENLDGYRHARLEWLKENSNELPHYASTLVLVAGLAKAEMLVELDVTAILP